jgi:Tol biopolymer transport system component
MTDLRSQLQSSLGDAYTIERELGGGGMSRVFLAKERALGRSVVIKVLPDETAGGVSVDRFRREIAVVAQLQHPHIVPLHTAGEVHGLPWFSMPFVTGETLRARLARAGEFPISDALRLLREVASALASAHAAGIVHRDIKPENILISGGAAMVTDFGVAKALVTATEGGADALTTRGIALGTPSYMAPEQASADLSTDHRADVYAWGVLAYELVTGTTPFAGRPPAAMLVAHITEAPESVSRRRPAVPDDLAALIMRCLEKRPADRPQSAAELVRALDAVTTPKGGTSAARISPRGRRFGLAGALLLVAAIGAVVYGTRAPTSYSAGRATAVVSTSGTLELETAISPDGRFVAYAAGATLRRRIEVRQIGGDRVIRVAEGLEVDQRWPRWSPDGTTILFTGGRSLYTVSAFGGRPTLILESSSSPITSDWSPGGDAIVYAAGDTLWTRSLAGGASAPVATGLGQLAAPAWSPDGRHIAFTRGNSAYLDSQGNVASSAIWIVPARGGEPWAVTDSSRLHFGTAWTPDARSILFVSDREGTRDVYQLPLSASARPNGEATRVTSGLQASTISLDATGTRMGYSVLLVRRNVWAVPIRADRASELADATPITQGNQSVEGVSVSRDGRWLLFDSNRGGNADVFKLELGASAGPTEPIPLTREPADDFLARFSPDGREIAFYSTRGGSRDVHVMKADGRDVVRVTDFPENEIYPDWSPDGRRLVFGSVRARGIGLAERKDDGTWTPAGEIEISKCAGRAAYPRWSVDGGTIASACGALGILLVSPDGRNPRVVPVTDVDVSFVEWDPRTPGAIFVKARPSGDIWTVSIPSGRARRVFQLNDPYRSAPRQEFASDGRRLFFTLSSDEADVWVMELTRSR